MRKNHEITIFNIKPSTTLDRSCFYLIAIEFEVDQKRFNYIDYLDPCTNTIVNHRVKSANYIVGNDRNKLLTELAMKLHLTDEDAFDLFSRIVQNINHEIDHSSKLRKQFPPFVDILRIALKFGFKCSQLAPEFHFMQSIRTPKGDVELHICTPSINEVIDELNYFAEKGTTGESYIYQQLVRMCLGHPDFFIGINPTGDGWIIYWYGEDAYQIHSRRVDTLKELYHGIMYRKTHSPYP